MRWRRSLPGVVLALGLVAVGPIPVWAHGGRTHFLFGFHFFFPLRPSPPAYVPYPVYVAPPPAYPPPPAPEPLPALGYLRSEVSPPEAQLFVDGAYLGRAGEFTGARLLALLPGRHRVEVVHPGFAPYTAELEVRVGETSELRAVLAPAPAPPPEPPRAVPEEPLR